MSQPIADPNGVTVKEFTEHPRLDLRLRALGGAAGLSRPIRHPRVQKSGLALAGHFMGVVPTRIQLLGETELAYIDSLGPRASEAARGFFSLGLSCVITTRAIEPPKSLVQAAEATGTPLFASGTRSSHTVNAIHSVLDEMLAPRTQLHGVLVDVFGVGLLLLGKSGIGKSECAVDLVLRGHRLVADDIVECDWRPPGMVFGAPAPLLRNHVEVRGLGVLNVQDMFGVTSVRHRKRIDVVVRLVEWSDKEDYDRLGVDDAHHEILSTQLRLLTVPVRPGRDMGSILEMAARNELLRRSGRHPARRFIERIQSGKAEEHDPDVEVESINPHAVGTFPPAPNSSVARPVWEGPARSNESSAWIPAVKPKEPT